MNGLNWTLVPDDPAAELIEYVFDVVYGDLGASGLLQNKPNQTQFPKSKIANSPIENRQFANRKSPDPIKPNFPSRR